MDFSSSGSPSETNNSVLPSPLAALEQRCLRPLDAALIWFDFGLDVIPVVRGTKRTAVQWDPWLQRLTREAVIVHWSRKPDDDVGFIVGSQYLVLDADSIEATNALCAVESRLGLAPRLRVKTTRGEHHFFLLASGAVAKTSIRSVAKNPCHIDVKTGRTLVVLAPSGGRSIFGLDELIRASELSVADQPFIDAVLVNNGEPPPRETDLAPAAGPNPIPDGAAIPLLRAALARLDPDIHYDAWLRVGAIVYNETGGSAAGFELWDDWSSEGVKYAGVIETRRKWSSFRPDHPRPVTLATLRLMLRHDGHDWDEICAEAEPFEVIPEEQA